jgi:hypothetical protein
MIPVAFLAIESFTHTERIADQLLLAIGASDDRGLEMGSFAERHTFPTGPRSFRRSQAGAVAVIDLDVIFFVALGEH